MSKDKLISDLQTSIQETIDSIKAIQGEPYARAVSFVHMSFHLGRLISIIANREAPDAAIHGVLGQLAQMTDLGLSTMADAYNMPEKTVKEILEWGKTLDKKTDQVLEELNK
jgi:hypothetical protein